MRNLISNQKRLLPVGNNKSLLSWEVSAERFREILTDLTSLDMFWIIFSTQIDQLMSCFLAGQGSDKVSFGI